MSNQIHISINGNSLSLTIETGHPNTERVNRDFFSDLRDELSQFLNKKIEQIASFPAQSAPLSIEVRIALLHNEDSKLNKLYEATKIIPLSTEADHLLSML